MMLSQSLRNTEATAGEPGTLTAVRTDQWPSWRSSASTWITATWRGCCGGWRPGSWHRATTTTWPSATRWRVRTEQRHPAGLRIHSLIALSEYEAFISGRTARTEAGVWGPLSLAGESWTVGLKAAQTWETMGSFLRALWYELDWQVEASSLSLWLLGWIYDVAVG